MMLSSLHGYTFLFGYLFSCSMFLFLFGDDVSFGEDFFFECIYLNINASGFSNYVQELSDLSFLVKSYSGTCLPVAF